MINILDDSFLPFLTWKKLEVSIFIITTTSFQPFLHETFSVSFRKKLVIRIKEEKIKKTKQRKNKEEKNEKIKISDENSINWCRM